jgi:hypothetical protein
LFTTAPGLFCKKVPGLKSGDAATRRKKRTGPSIGAITELFVPSVVICASTGTQLVPLKTQLVRRLKLVATEGHWT